VRQKLLINIEGHHLHIQKTKKLSTIREIFYYAYCIPAAFTLLISPELQGVTPYVMPQLEQFVMTVSIVNISPHSQTIWCATRGFIFSLPLLFTWSTIALPSSNLEHPQLMKKTPLWLN
jgi:hypothetical protein